MPCILFVPIILVNFKILVKRVSIFVLLTVK